MNSRSHPQLPLSFGKQYADNNYGTRLDLSQHNVTDTDIENILIPFLSAYPHIESISIEINLANLPLQLLTSKALYSLVSLSQLNSLSICFKGFMLDISEQSFAYMQNIFDDAVITALSQRPFKSLQLNGFAYHPVEEKLAAQLKTTTLTLSNTYLSASIAGVLARNNSIEKLVLNHCCLNDEGMQLLTKGKFSELDVSNNNLTSDGILAFTNNQYCTQLILSNNRIQGALIEFSANNMLRSLDISYNPLSAESFKNLSLNTVLLSLNISNCIPINKFALPSLPLQLTILNLKNNSLDSNDAVRLLALTNLIDLNLSGNNKIRGAKLIELVSTLSLTSLDLSDLTIKKKLIKALASSPTLINLCLDNCEIADNDLMHLIKNTHLQHLSLFGNNITDNGAKILALQGSLTSVDLLDNCEISTIGVKALASNHHLSNLMIEIESESETASLASTDSDDLNSSDSETETQSLISSDSDYSDNSDFAAETELLNTVNITSIQPSTESIVVKRYQALRETNPLARANYARDPEVNIKHYDPVPSLLRLSLYKIKTSPEINKSDLPKWIQEKLAVSRM